MQRKIIIKSNILLTHLSPMNQGNYWDMGGSALCGFIRNNNTDAFIVYGSKVTRDAILLNHSPEYVICKKCLKLLN